LIGTGALAFVEELVVAAVSGFLKVLRLRSHVMWLMADSASLGVDL
jgi:hypothetical protein